MLCGDIHPCPGPDAGSLYTNFKKRGTHFIHLNVRSILPKIDQILLIAIETKPACLLFYETWLDNSVFDSEVSIPNQVVCRNDRNRHGEVYVCVRHDISLTWGMTYVIRSLIQSSLIYFYQNPNPLLLELSTDHHPRINFKIYWKNYFCLVKISAQDLNKNVSSRVGNSLNKSLHSICDLFSCKQLIKYITGVYSSTIIDLI